MFILINHVRIWKISESKINEKYLSRYCWNTSWKYLTINKLNDIFKTPWLIQSNFSKDDETTRITDILTSISQTNGNINADGNLEVNGTEISEYKLYKYSNNMGSMFQAFSNGELDRNEAMYYLSQISGTIDGIVNEFRNLSSSEQETYLPLLFNLLSTKDINVE